MKNATIRRMYECFSSIPWFWELDAWTCRATSRSPYRARVIDGLEIDSSSRVLDVACGTGLNFDLLQEKLGGEGSLVGVDQSRKTLTLARRRVERRGWKNVRLLEVDSAAFRPEERFDAALCTFAIEIIPPYRETLAMMIDALKPGGRLGIVGFRSSRRAGFSLLNPLCRAVAVPFGGVVLDRGIRSLVRERCAEVLYEEVYGGFYYLLVAQRA